METKGMTTKQYFEANPIVLADLTRFSVFNFYPSMDAAVRDRDRAIRNAIYPGTDYQPMQYDEFHARERTAMLSHPAVEVTGEKFTSMLGVLPPVAYRCTDTFSSFLMCEHFSGPYTSQYAAYRTVDGWKYYEKLVDAYDQSTWMTAESH